MINMSLEALIFMSLSVLNKIPRMHRDIPITSNVYVKTKFSTCWYWLRVFVIYFYTCSPNILATNGSSDVALVTFCVLQ